MEQGSARRLDWLGVPRDARGIVLACGYIGAAAVGVGALISSGDPIGLAYIAVALVGYLFLQTRGLPALLWLLIAAYGAAGALAGAAADWIECAIGLVLASVALIASPARPKSLSASVHSNRDEEGQLIKTSAPPVTTPIPPTDGRGDSTSHERSAAGPLPETSRLVIRSIGLFRIHSGDLDLTDVLEGKAVLSFLFKYLFARATMGEPKLARTAFGDEMLPGSSTSSQLKRARQQIYDLQNDIGPQLGALVQANRTYVWLDLEDVDSDIATLRRLSTEVSRNTGLISSQLAVEMADLLRDVNFTEFLPAFEELERHVTQGRGTAGQTVQAARAAITKQLADLTRALTEYEDTMGRPGSTIPHLQSVLDQLPDRQDIARLLATAYLKTGQTARANEVRQQFALGKE